MADLPTLANLDYRARVNRAVDYIQQHLDDRLQLEDVARVACFSPFHFHRIFSAVMGETLASFVKRIRLERAVHLLSHRPGESLTAIALACGFSSSSDFSRSFRRHYGVPPRHFDAALLRRVRRDGMQALVPALHAHGGAESPVDTAPDAFIVTLRTLPGRHVAYIRVHNPYEGDGVVQAATRLLAWAEARGLGDGQWLGYQWDNPEIVALEKCLYDVGLEVPEDVAAEGEVSLTTFPECLVAEVDIAGGIALEMRALDWLYRVWLPTSGYAPAHQPGFEAWNGRPFAHGIEHFEVRIQLPVISASLPL